jgi:hypothetical protein
MTLEFCITGEKWFASGESKIFRISRSWINLRNLNIFKLYNICSGKDFEPRRSHFSKVLIFSLQENQPIGYACGCQQDLPSRQGSFRKAR